tara:strand:- start:1245 stop:1406 length:162 start_codon:yes stop_codon:yes gene_type:complete
MFKLSMLLCAAILTWVAVKVFYIDANGMGVHVKDFGGYHVEFIEVSPIERTVR